jgi:hypothetical protein
MLDQDEGLLTYQCPVSGRSVRTTIQTSRKILTRLGAFKISVWCPHCRGPHSIGGKDASLAYPPLAKAG